MKIIAKQDFTSNIGSYVKGDEIKVKDIEKIKKLNELGFIEPLSFKDIIVLNREINEQKDETIKEEN